MGFSAYVQACIRSLINPFVKKAMPSMLASHLQEILALSWCQNILGAAHADEIDENGWVSEVIGPPPQIAPKKQVSGVLWQAGKRRRGRPE